jgi:hypothetical protein
MYRSPLGDAKASFPLAEYSNNRRKTTLSMHFSVLRGRAAHV